MRDPDGGVPACGSVLGRQDRAEERGGPPGSRRSRVGLLLLLPVVLVVISVAAFFVTIRYDVIECDGWECIVLDRWTGDVEIREVQWDEVDG